MLTEDEILSGTDPKTLSNEILDNVQILLTKMNEIRKLWGRPMIVTSGVRSMKHHIEIYAKKGITDLKKIPMKSKHLTGEACDIFDMNHDLQKWCLANEDILVRLDLWCEDFGYTPQWIHFQIVPPKSGKRFFIP